MCPLPHLGCFIFSVVSFEASCFLCLCSALGRPVITGCRCCCLFWYGSKDFEANAHIVVGNFFQSFEIDVATGSMEYDSGYDSIQCGSDLSSILEMRMVACSLSEGCEEHCVVW